MQRVTVVDDEAELEGNTVLAHLTPEILGGDRRRPGSRPAGPGGCGTQCGVDGHVDVGRARHP